MSDQKNQVFMSPFLNFDPSILVTNPDDQYLHFEGKDERSRFDRSCCEIGGMVIGGGFVGGVSGMYKGLFQVKGQDIANKSIQRVQVLNYMTKMGGGYAQRCGTIGLLYALSDAMIQFAGVTNESVSTVAAATSAGFIFSCGDLTRGWRRVRINSALGCAIGLSFVGLSNWDKFQDFMGRLLKY